MRIAYCIVFALCCVPCGLSATGEPEFVYQGKCAVVQAAGITEASGAAASRLHPNAWWVLNDSGGTPQLHLLGADGASKGEVTVEGARNTDWEDMAAFVSEGVPRLLIADTGDNNAARPHASLLIVREPAIPAGNQPVKGSVKIERRIDFQFAGGARDCEAVAVDVSGKRILLLTKRTKPAELHELPLHPKPGKTLPVTRQIATLQMPPPPRFKIAFATQPTAMDLSPDGSTLAVLTYYCVTLFHRAEGKSWQDAAAAPRSLVPHLLPQAEAIGFSSDGASIRVFSEGKRQPVMRYDKNKKS